VHRSESSFLASAFTLLLMLALAVVPLPDAAAPFRPDWVAVVLLYWALAAPRRFSLMTAFWMGIALDLLTGALLGQHSLALVLVVYIAERFHLRLRAFPLSQLALTVLVLLMLYEFMLFWVDGVAGRTVPLIERWAPPLTGAAVWVVLRVFWGSDDRREARARL
jgi:rod shape-determining protein MreD